MSDDSRRPPALHAGGLPDDGPSPDVTPEEAARWEALARQVAGEATPADELLLGHWLSDDPAAAEEIRALSEVVHRVSFSAPPALDVEGALERVRRKRGDRGMLAPPGRRAAREEGMGRTFFTPSLRAAAAILVVATGALVWRSLARDDAPPPARYSSGAGAPDTVLLHDGTRVILGPRSVLEVSHGYGTPLRRVSLEGQAEFDVKHDAARAFSVVAGSSLVQDIGTRFSIRTRSTGAVVVSVGEGSVLLRRAPAAAAASSSTASRDTGVVLAAGDRGVLPAAGAAAVERGVNLDADFAWTRGELVFRDAPMAEVADELERWYGLHLWVDPLLAGRHVTASFHGESPAGVLRVIGIVLGARAEQHGDTVNLRPGMP